MMSYFGFIAGADFKFLFENFILLFFKFETETANIQFNIFIVSASIVDVMLR